MCPESLRRMENHDRWYCLEVYSDCLQEGIQSETSSDESESENDEDED